MKNVMKKIFAGVLAVAVIAGCTGCGVVQDHLELSRDMLDLVQEQVEEAKDRQERYETVKEQLPDVEEKDEEQTTWPGVDVSPSLNDSDDPVTVPNETETDYDKLIDNYVPTALNQFSLTAGQAHKPGAAVWLQSGMGGVYSSNPDVVTISDLGKVTAVGEGEAYIVITWRSMSAVYHYTVTVE